MRPGKTRFTDLDGRTFSSLVKTTFEAWMGHHVQRLGAALAFYTVTAVPPLFVIVLYVASLWFNAATARAQILDEVAQLIGSEGADALKASLLSPVHHTTGPFASLVALGALLVTTTGLFLELQDDLNTIWDVEKIPGQGVRGFILNRLLSFAMIMGIGFLLLVSLLLSAALAAMSKYFMGRFPLEPVLWEVVNLLVSLGLITLLFAMIFKVLPDVKMAWSNVWIGGAITSALFTVGKLLLGIYLGRSTIASAYGAAGSVVIILLWVYYSAQILFFGAEFTRVFTRWAGGPVEPGRHARWRTPWPAAPPRSGMKNAMDSPGHAAPPRPKSPGRLRL